MNESKFKFNNPVLEHLEFGINDKFEEEKYHGIEINGETQITRVKNKEKALVKLCLYIGEQTDAAPFWIKVSMRAKFVWEKNMKPELVERLLQANAPSLLLSYIRPIVSNITSNTQFPTFNIPFMDMQDNLAIIEDGEI